MARALSPEPPRRARPRTVSPRSRAADPAAAARLSQTGHRPGAGGSPNAARRRRRGAGLKSPDLARELFRIESLLTAPDGDDAAALYERRLLHAFDPHGTPSKRGSRNIVGAGGGSALQAKHAAATKTSDATAAKDGGGSSQTYRVALRDFARQQREAEREWDKLISNPARVEETWAQQPSPARERELEPEPPPAPEPEPELRPMELWLQESQDARVNDAVTAALRNAEAEKAAKLAAVREQHRRDIEVEMAVSNAAAQRAAELDEGKTAAEAEAAAVKEALERASGEVEQMREREAQLVVKMVSAEDTAAAATAAATNAAAGAAVSLSVSAAVSADGVAPLPPLDSPRRIAVAAADALTRAAQAEAETTIAKASLQRSNEEMETLKARELELTTQLKASAEETTAAVAAVQAAAMEVKSPPRRPPPRPSPSQGGQQVQAQAQVAAEEAAAAYSAAADDARARATRAEAEAESANAETEATKLLLAEAHAHLSGLQTEHRSQTEQLVALEVLREEHRTGREEAEALVATLTHANESRRLGELDEQAEATSWAEADEIGALRDSNDELGEQVRVIRSERKEAMADAVRANRACDAALQDAKALRTAVREQDSSSGGGGSSALSVCAWIGIVIVVAFVMYCAGAIGGHSWKCDAACAEAVAHADALPKAVAAQVEAELQVAALQSQVVSLRTHVSQLEAVPPPLPPPPLPPPVAVEASRLAVYRGCQAEWRLKDAAECDQQHNQQQQQKIKKQPAAVVVEYEWYAPVFSPCSVECGQREVVQMRFTSCLAVTAGAGAGGNRSRIARDESSCEDASVGAKPASRTVCPSTPACADAEAEEQAEASRRAEAEEILTLRDTNDELGQQLRVMRQQAEAARQSQAEGEAVEESEAVAEAVAAVVSVQAQVESREVHIAALQEHITDVELELDLERNRCGGKGQQTCPDCGATTGGSAEMPATVMVGGVVMIVGLLLAFLWHSGRSGSQVLYDQNENEMALAALQKELDDTLSQQDQREDQAAQGAGEAARAAGAKAVAETAEEWERQREHLLDQLSECEADKLEQKAIVQTLRAQSAEVERRHAVEDSSVASSHTRFETETDLQVQVQQTEHWKQLADAQAEVARLSVEIDGLHRRCTMLQAEKRAVHELLKQRDGEFFKKIATEAHAAGQTAAGNDIAPRRTLSDVERECRGLEEEKRKAELKLDVQREAAEAKLAAQRNKNKTDVGEVARREEAEQRLSACTVELETQRLATAGAETRAAAQVTAALYEQQQRLYAAEQARPPPMSPLASPVPRASSADKQVNVILRLRKVCTLAVFNKWADWSARQRRMKRLCKQQLGRRTRHLVGVMFVAWVEAQREAADAALVTARGAERAELERQMEEQAAAASEAAGMIYAAVEEERTTHQVKMQLLQGEVQILRAAATAMPSPRTVSLSVEVAVAAAVADVTCAAEEATAAAVRAAKEEARCLAEEEMSVLTPRESARVKMADREAELESKAAAAMEGLRKACESEASTQLMAAQSMAQTMMEQAAKDAQAQATKAEAEATQRAATAAATAAELSAAATATAELELSAADEKRKELEGLLRGSREEFNELEEKLKVAATEFHTAAEEAAAVACKKAVADAGEEWERQTHEAVWLAVQEAEGKAAEEMAVVEAEAEASAELAVAEAMLEAEVEKDQAVEDARTLAKDEAAAAVAAVREEARSEAEEDRSGLTPRDSAAARFKARELELESALEDLREEVKFVQQAGSDIEEELAAKTLLCEANGDVVVRLEAELREAERLSVAVLEQARSTEHNEVAAAKAWGEELLEAERTRHASQSDRSRAKLVETEEAADEAGERLSLLQERCAVKLSMRIMAVVVLRAWSGLARDTIRQMRVLGLLFGKREGRAVESTFTQWKGAVREMWRRRVLLTRAVVKTSQRQVSKAWSSWAGVVASIREQRLVGAHDQMVTGMDAKIREAKMSHMHPRTHLHCKTCQCAPRNKAERKRTVSSPAAAAPLFREAGAAAAGAASGSAESPFAALGQYSPSSLAQALGGGGDGSSSDGDGALLGTGNMTPTELLQATPPSSPSRSAVAAATTPSPARSASTASTASPSRSVQSDRSSRSSRRPPRRKSSGEGRDSFMKF